MFFRTSPPSLPHDAQRAVRDYEQRIRELLESCADHQRHDPEVFLWNARRALEAMCHLLLTVHRTKPSRVEKATNETSLDGMIRQLKHEGVLDREQGPRFDLARSHTNLGVHIQQPEREDYAAAVADTAHILPGLLEWLYEDSIATPYLRGREGLPVEVIREGGREGPSLKDAATVARTEQQVAELTASALRAQLGEKERALRARETRWWRWLWRMTLASATCFALGLCLGSTGMGVVPDGWFEAVADASPVASPSDPVASQPPAVPVVAPVAGSGTPASTAVLSVAGAALDTTAPVAPATTCATGMVLVPAIADMRLGQPVGGRKNWPPPARRTLDPMDVPAFCLDARPRGRSGVEPDQYDAAAVAQCEKNAAERSKDRTCLSRDEAERTCAAAAPGGHLPTVAEWESAARAKVDGLLLPEHEWVGERFPPAVFLRSDPEWSMGDGMWVGRIPKGREPESPNGAVLLAWNQQAPTNRHVERTFRCAVAAR